MRIINTLFCISLLCSFSAQAQFIGINPPGVDNQPVIAGTKSMIKDISDLKALAESPGDVIDIKFLIKDYPNDPKVYFMSETKYPWHYQLASTLDQTDYEKTQFSKDCLDHSTGYVCGFLKFIPGVDPEEREYNKSRYLWYLYHHDQVTIKDISKLHDLLKVRLPHEFLWDLISGGGEFVYYSSWMPQGDQQIQWANTSELISAEPIFPHQLLKKGEEKILNPGFAVGNMRVVSDPNQLKSLTYTDFVILDMDHIPLDLPPVAGVISRVDQHKLSHINLLSKNRGTPNVYIHGVLEKANYKALIGKKVKFKARKNQVKILTASEDEFEKFWSQKRPSKVTHLSSNLKEVGPFDLKASSQSVEELMLLSGAKATNLTRMHRIPNYPVPSFLASIPFYWYDQHMMDNGIWAKFKAKIESDQMRVDFDFREKTLKDLRAAIKKTPLNAELIKELKALFAKENNPEDSDDGLLPYDTSQPLRFRSSSNAEDLKFFNGAGLYDSKSGYFRPPQGLEKKTAEMAIKKVWASLWNLQAFQEREFYKLDHVTAKMAVLVQPSYPSKREKANGVALVNKIWGDRWEVEANIAEGDRSITNPEPGDDRPTALVKMVVSNDGVTITTPKEQWDMIVSLKELENLAQQLKSVQVNLGDLSTDGAKLDFEYKWVDDNRDLLVKQVRPLRTKINYFNAFDGEKSKSGQDLSGYYNVSYNYCSSPYVDYIEENGDRNALEPYTAHVKLIVKKDMEAEGLKKGDEFEFIHSGSPDGVYIGHPFMHHGPYDLYIKALEHAVIQFFEVPSLGSVIKINNSEFSSPVTCEAKVVYTNWARTLEREME